MTTMLRTMGALSFVFLCFLIATPVWAQLSPAFPLTQGGFQVGSSLADNGWEVVNGSTNNQWVVGGNYPGATDGRCLYLSNDFQSANPTATLAESTVPGQVVHVFRTFSLPANDSAIFLQFRLTSEVGANISLNVHLDTLLTPVVAGSVSGTPIWRVTSGIINGGLFTPYSLHIPRGYAGRTIRLRFEYRPLGVINNIFNARGYALDDVAVLTRPFTTATITAQAAGGDWSSSSTWVGGLVPATGEDVLIPAGTTVNLDAAGEPGGRNISLQGAITGELINPGTPGSLNTWGSLTLAGTGRLQLPDRTVRVGGHLTAQPGASIDLRRGTLILDSTGLVSVQRVISLDSMGQFDNRVLAAFQCSAPEGMRFQVTNSLNDTLRIFSSLILSNGLINHGGRLLINNTVGSSLAAGFNPPVFTISIVRGSLSAFPTLGQGCNLEARYSHTATLQSPLVAGSRNELPSNRQLARITVGTAFSVLRFVDNIWLTDNASNTLWLFGPTIVDAGKRVTLLQANAAASTANQGMLQGKLVLTVNSTAGVFRRFPVGINGIPNHLELRGVTSSGEARIGVEAVTPAGTPTAPLTALSPLARLRVTIDSGSVTGITNVAAFYTVADGIQPNQVANLRIGGNTTSINGNYVSVGPSTPPTASPIVSDLGNWAATTAYYTLALEGGTFRKLWTGAAGDNSWDTPENWSGNTLPTCADSVALAPQFVTIKLNGDRQVGGLEIGSQTLLELQSGSRLRVGCAPGTGRLQINGLGGIGHIYGIKALPGSSLRVE